MSVWDAIKIGDKALATPSSTSGAEYPAFLSEKYGCSSPLGNGSFGQAYVVTEVATGNKYVAKVMSTINMTARDIQHVQNEVGCLSQCHDVPIIIRQIEVLTHGTSLVMILEYADGGDLWKEITARKKKHPVVKFHTDEIAMIFVQVCMAVDFVHSRNILHRDIKPANVFFTSAGLVKLGDFGFSKQYNETLSNPVGHTICGTPYYMCPEMWLDERYSKKSDLWSIGVLLYEMMTFARPFCGESIGALSEAIRKGEFAPIPEASNFHPDLITACYGMLRKDPSSRMDIKTILSLPLFQQTLQTINSLLDDPTMLPLQPSMRALLGGYTTLR
eukprot:PhF_6_TR26346/c1_g1_i1/m.37911/K08857/NEK1_4_5; NIMA (never in mitosis gene a)-related kinase 1/4/5